MGINCTLQKSDKFQGWLGGSAGTSLSPPATPLISLPLPTGLMLQALTSESKEESWIQSPFCGSK